MAAIKETVDEIHADVKAIQLQLAGQKGFVAGVMTVAALAWTLVLLGASAVYNWWKAQ